MQKLIVLLLALASVTAVRAQVIGLPLTPAGAEDAPSCPTTPNRFKTPTTLLGIAGSVAGGSVVYFCVAPVKSGTLVQSGTLHIDYVTGFLAYPDDRGAKVALKMYVDGAIVPVIAERVSPANNYAVAQNMSWALDVTGRVTQDMKDRPVADPHIFIDLRQGNVPPVKGAYLYISGHYE